MADVVILSSDEEKEDERETGRLFQDFLTKVGPFVDRTVVDLLSTKFDERADVASSSSFRSLLLRKIEVVGSNDAYIHAGEICKVLRGSKGKSPSIKPQKCDATNSGSCVVKTELLGECTGDSSGAPVTSTAGEFKNGNKDSSSPKPPMGSPQVQEIDDDIVIVEVPSAKDFRTETPANPSSPQPTCSVKQLKAKATNAKKVVSPSKRKKVIRRLEEKMKVVSEQIKILNRAELSLDEMGMSDSTYMKECRLKERFNKIWNKICTLQGKPPNTGRVVEKEIKCPTTGYPVIDEEVHKFMKKRRSFPDIFDVKEVINKTNLKHDLRISAPVLQELAEEVFTNIGNRLQRRRKTDFNNNFGCFLTDDYDCERDPAVHDPDLRRKLEKNQKKSKHALNKVFRKFVHYDRLKYCDGRDGLSPACSTDGQSDNEDERPSRQGRIRKKADSHSSSSASESELNENLPRSSKTKEHSGDADNDRRSAKNGDHLSSDVSDFESISRNSQPGEKETSEYVSDSDRDKSSQETVCSSQPEPLLSAKCSPGNSDRNSQRIPEQAACDSNSIEESRSLSQSTAEGPGKPTCQNARADDDDCLTNGIKASENQAVITIIDDADEESTEVVLSCQERSSNTVPCHVSSPSEKGSVKESAKSSAASVENFDLTKQSNEVGEQTAAVTNGEVSVKPRAASSEPEVKASTAVKIASPLKCSINLKSVSLPKEPKDGLNSAKVKVEHQTVGKRKRPAKNDCTIYESPLKVFRKSTLELLQKEGLSDKLVRPETEQRVSVNGQLSCNTNHGRNSALEISAEASDNNSITNKLDESPKKSLSLKRKHQDKEVLDDAPVAVIILSDDDSD